MKKLYAITIAIFAAGMCSAQHTLTEALHAPASGDTYAMYQCDSTGITGGASGTGALWTYSAIATRSSVIYNYSAITNTNTTSFPNASVMVSSSGNDQSFYSSGSSFLKYHGGNINVQSVKASLMYTSAAVYAGYPMSHPSTTTSVVGGNINVTSPLTTSGTFTGNCSVSVDGTGTLVMPGAMGIYTNVIRVVNSQTLDFVVQMGAITGNVIQRTYEFYMAGTKAPIFSIVSSTANVLGSPYTSVLVMRNKNSAGIDPPAPPTTVTVQEMAQDVKVSVFPNPASSQVNFVTGNSSAKSVSVFDITGKLMVKQEMVDGKATMDVSSLNRGLYLYSITTGANNVITSGKLTVGH